MIDVGVTAVPSLVMVGWAVKSRFSPLRKSHLEVPANDVAGLSFVAAAFEVVPQSVVEGASWVSFEPATDVAFSALGPFHY